MKLSVVVPVYNEKQTILEILTAIKRVVLSEKITGREIILVDDCSTDGTREILQKIEKQGSGQRPEPIKSFFILKRLYLTNSGFTL